MISVVIPTLNEAATLPALLRSLEREREPHEVVVSDGGSIDGTADLATVRGAPGRARQINRGAAAARGDVLFFLHADSRLPDGALSDVRRAIDRGSPGGCFYASFEHPHPLLRAGDAYRNLRTRLFRECYGDQGIFCTRDAFDRLGGCRDLPFMEDYDFAVRLRALGRFAVIPRALGTSPRRYLRRGIVRQHLLNLAAKIAFRSAHAR